MAAKKYETFAEFYPFYLTEHQDLTCRRLHFVGTSLIIAVAVTAVATGQYWLLFTMPLFGYGFAWVGHFAFEKNKPASFSQPFYSLVSDFVMFKDILTGQVDRKIEEARKIIGEKDAAQNVEEAAAAV